MTGLFTKTRLFFTDSTVFKISTYHFIYGDPRTALVAPNSMVLTKSVSEKFFGKNNAIGELLQTDDGANYKITGVVDDVPKSSHLIFKVLISMSSIPKQDMGDWAILEFTLMSS